MIFDKIPDIVISDGVNWPVDYLLYGNEKTSLSEDCYQKSFIKTALAVVLVATIIIPLIGFLFQGIVALEYITTKEIRKEMDALKEGSEKIGLFYEEHIYPHLKKSNPWQNPDFLKQYDEFMNLSATQTSLYFTMINKKSRGNVFYMARLMKNGNFQAAFFRHNIYKDYSFARRHAGLIPCKRYDISQEKLLDLISDEYYTEGTLQSGWRKIYNQFCEKFDEFKTKDGQTLTTILDSTRLTTIFSAKDRVTKDESPDTWKKIFHH